VLQLILETYDIPLHELSDLKRLSCRIGFSIYRIAVIKQRIRHDCRVRLSADVAQKKEIFIRDVPIY
jgi:hypothetical protein